MTKSIKFLSWLLTALLVASCSLIGHSIDLEPETSAQVEMPKDDAQSQNREENAVIATNPETDCTKIMGGHENTVDKDVINIAMASDNNYTYPLIVAMTSILENKNPDTKIDFYIMLSGDFHDENKTKIMSLQSKYTNCRITLIDMKDKFKDAYLDKYVGIATYYRLVIASLLPNLDKVLYLDTDIIVRKDLKNLYNYNLSDYYLGGVLRLHSEIPYKAYEKWLPTESIQFINVFGQYQCKNKYINAGIALFNLKKIREDLLEPIFIERASAVNFSLHDQDILNIICYNRILKLPSIYNKSPSCGISKEQVIIHYIGAFSKPWDKPSILLANLWWQYAEKTDYFKEIQAKYLSNNHPVSTPRQVVAPEALIQNPKPAPAQSSAPVKPASAPAQAPAPSQVVAPKAPIQNSKPAPAQSSAPVKPASAAHRAKPTAKKHVRKVHRAKRVGKRGVNNKKVARKGKAVIKRTAKKHKPIPAKKKVVHRKPVATKRPAKRHKNRG